MTVRTTTALARVEMLLTQAERFADLAAHEEARARARQVIAYAEREKARCPEEGEELEALALLAEGLLKRLGASARDARGCRTIDAGDAALPEAWD